MHVGSLASRAGSPTYAEADGVCNMAKPAQRSDGMHKLQMADTLNEVYTVLQCGAILGCNRMCLSVSLFIRSIIRSLQLEVGAKEVGVTSK